MFWNAYDPSPTDRNWLSVSEQRVLSNDYTLIIAKEIFEDTWTYTHHGIYNDSFVFIWLHYIISTSDPKFRCLKSIIAHAHTHKTYNQLFKHIIFFSIWSLIWFLLKILKSYLYFFHLQPCYNFDESSPAYYWVNDHFQEAHLTRPFTEEEIVSVNYLYKEGKFHIPGHRLSILKFFAVNNAYEIRVKSIILTSYKRVKVQNFTEAWDENSLRSMI